MFAPKKVRQDICTDRRERKKVIKLRLEDGGLKFAKKEVRHTDRKNRKERD